MSRVKRGNNRRMRRKKVLARAKGYFLSKRNCYRIAKIQVDRSLLFAYRDRRQRKRQMRRLWITRIGAAARMNGLSYSRLMDGLNKGNVAIDRKMLADLAVRHPEAFARLASHAQAALTASASG